MTVENNLNNINLPGKSYAVRRKTEFQSGTDKSMQINLMRGEILGKIQVIMACLHLTIPIHA